MKIGKNERRSNLTDQPNIPNQAIGNAPAVTMRRIDGDRVLSGG
ncbi:MAG TPA: hypothetical protein VGF06_14065 [Terriglobales bacterium]|jgi:hypothetical protein